jgi:transcriptional regulator
MPVMYVKPDYAARDLPLLHEMIESARFGLLVLCADGPLAAHIPFVLHRDRGPFGTLVAHVARADPLARHLAAGPEALAIFSGPRAYVSPRWYPDGGLPTYNFLAVHACGRPRPLEDRDAVLAHLAELVAVHEAGSPWSLDSAPDGRVDELLPHILAFTLEISSIQGKRKLSQTRSAEERAGVIQGLSERGSEDDLEIAAVMSDDRSVGPG